MRAWLQLIWELPRRVIILFVRGYQYTLSPLIGQGCRFQPSCSNYMIQAVNKHGAVIGSCKGIWRICRCNPWCQGGHDPP